VLALIAEARTAGARLAPACKVLGLSVRTVQRWKRQEVGEDKRQGPKRKPANALSEEERTEVLGILNSPKFRGLPPTQIVPRLADQGVYLASESTCYRILRDQGQLPEASSKRNRVKRAKPRHVVNGPNQLWCWDITYLHCEVRGHYLYLYMFMDVWSRKIVGWEVHASERAVYSARLIEQITKGMKIEDLVLHMDNGAPMKGAPMLRALQGLRITASYSRPRVSNDNPFVESLFSTCKSRPGFPVKRFSTLEEARAWVARFVDWYNEEHCHSAIGYVTPSERHAGQAEAILERRRRLYAKARQRRPGRWSGSVRRWEAPTEVSLNPEEVADQRRVAKPADPSSVRDLHLPCSTSTSRSPTACGSLPSGR